MSKTIILVHGTFAASKEGVTQWYELGKDHKGSFVNQIEAEVRGRGDVSPITWCVFRWSGANVHEERLAAAEELYAQVRALLAASPADELFIIAHSHGGNVALKALELLWRRGPEAEYVFEAFLRAIGIERLFGPAAASRVIACCPELSSLSPSLREFLNNAAKALWFTVQLEGRGPSPESDPASQEQWIAATRGSNLTGSVLEAFSLRWSMERRPRLHLITLGTPFLQKVWKPRQSSRSPRVWLATAVLAATAAAVLSSCVLWVDRGRLANPLDQEWLELWLTMTVILYVLAMFVRTQYSREDTNVYFNIDSAFGDDSVRAASKPWRLSVIHGGLLDEALLGLSAEPLILAELAPRFKKPLTPRLKWALPKPTEERPSALILWAPVGLFNRLRQAAALLARWGYNFTIGLLLRSVGWALVLVAHQFLLKTVLRSINSGGLGIPEHEFRDARINVVPVPALIAFFDQDFWDATQALVDEAPVRLTTEDRRAQWGFLWDKELVATEIRESQIWKRISPALPLIKQNPRSQFEDELWFQRLSLAVEERLREAFGLIPLNHSGYYSNQKVIGRIGELLSSRRSTRAQETL